jgi:hypothetical protein
MGGLKEMEPATLIPSHSHSNIQVQVPDSDEADTAEHIYTCIHMRKRCNSDD